MKNITKTKRVKIPANLSFIASSSDSLLFIFLKFNPIDKYKSNQHTN